MTDRDTFAAAALTGLLAQGDDGSFSEESYARGAYRWADAMLRERAKTNLDAAPEARASVGRPRTDKADLPTRASTGDTQEPVAWGVAYPNDEVAVIAFKRQDAEARATASDRIVPLYRHPPVTEPMPSEKRAEVSDRSKPINGPDPDSRVWETPVHTPAPHATPGDGSVPREGTQEPVAWGVANGKGLLATSISRIDAVDMQSYYACDTAVVPLYRQAPDFAPPPPDNAAKAPDNAEPVAWAVCTPSDGHWSPCYFHEPHAQRCANAIVGEKNVVPLYRSPPVTKPMPKEKRAEVSAGPLAWAAIRENGQPLWLSYDRSGAEGMVNGMAEVIPLYRKPTLTDAERDDICVWLAECLRQASTATEGCNEELAERWQGRAKRAAAMIERLGGEG